MDSGVISAIRPYALTLDGNICQTIYIANNCIVTWLKDQYSGADKRLHAMNKLYSQQKLLFSSDPIWAVDINLRFIDMVCH